MRKSIYFSNKAVEVAESYAQKRDCSFNKAVNDIVERYQEAMSRGKCLAQANTRLEQDKARLEQENNLLLQRVADLEEWKMRIHADIQEIKASTTKCDT